MWACTDLHSARMFPSPKPVAPLRSISSRKKVSSAKMGFVNTWRRYLRVGQQQDKHFLIDPDEKLNSVCWFFCYPNPLAGTQCSLSDLLCLFTFSFPQTQTVMKDPGGGQYPGEFRAAPTSGGRALPPLSLAVYPPVVMQRMMSHNLLTVLCIVICGLF